MKRAWIKLTRYSRTRRGVALISVLSLISLVTVVSLSYFLLTRDDRARSRAFLDMIRSRVMIESAAQEVLAKIIDGSEIAWSGGKATGMMSASAGMIKVVRFDIPYNRAKKLGDVAASNIFAPNGSIRNPFAEEYPNNSAGTVMAPANPRLIPLFSWRWFAPTARYLRYMDSVDTNTANPDFNPAIQFNINTAQNPFYPGQLYLSGRPSRTAAVRFSDASEWTDAVYGNNQNAFRYNDGQAALDRPIYVQWLPIYENPREGARYTNEFGVVVPNRIVGRYCYWVDLENAKVNLNTTRRSFEKTGLAALTGFGDGELNGTKRLFRQTITDSVQDSIEAQRLGFEGDLVVRKGSGANSVWNYTRDGVTNVLPNNNTARGYRDLGLGWNTNATDPDDELPYFADNSRADWRAFVGVRPWGTGTDTNFILQELMNGYDPDAEGPLNFHTEAYSLLDPQIASVDPVIAQERIDAFRRTYMLSTTIYGYEEERDPLGQPKIDIVQLQREGVGGTAWNELWSRLQDPDYHNIYKGEHLEVITTTNSFIEGYNTFAGDMDPSNDANGEWFARQLLVNIIAYAHDGPPLSTPGFDTSWTNNGIWPNVPIPYVQEVGVRARNLLWDLPSSTRTALTTNDFIVEVPIGTNTNTVPETVTNAYYIASNAISGRAPSDYMSKIIVDGSLAFMNPNIYADYKALGFSDNEFDGRVVLNYDWNGASYTTNISLNGHYGVYPLPGESGSDTHGVDQHTRTTHVGFTATQSSKDRNGYFYLGEMDGTELIRTDTHPNALRIRSWRIEDTSGNLWHQVPMNHLGASGTPVDWCDMTANGVFTGTWKSSYSLAQYQNAGTSLGYFEGTNFVNNNTNWGFRPTAWFAPETMSSYGLTNLFLNLDTNVAIGATPFLISTNISEDSTNNEVFMAVTNWLTFNTKGAAQAMVERVYTLDGSVSHRTVDTNSYTEVTQSRLGFESKAATPAVNSTNMTGNVRGHFYGVTGHTWRRIPVVPLVTTEETIPARTYQTQQITGYTTTNVTTKIADGVGWKTVTITYEIPVYTTVTVTDPPQLVITTTGGLVRSLLSDFMDAGSSTNILQDRYGLENGNTGGGNGANLYNLFMNEGLMKHSGGANAALISRQPIAGETWKGWLEETKTQSDLTIGNPGSDIAKIMTDFGGLRNRGILASAHKGDFMVNIGELVYVHSGIPQSPLGISPDALNSTTAAASTDYYFDSSKHGPPMMMLFDQFTPGSFRDQNTFQARSATEWRQSGTGSNPSNSPLTPRRGTWNINTGMASDHYMVIREGYYKDYPNHENDSTRNPSTAPAWIQWMPMALAMQAKVPMSSSPESVPLDPWSSPFARFRRGWESWMTAIAGDWTTYRAGTYSIWDLGNDLNTMSLLGLRSMTWNVGWGATWNGEAPTLRSRVIFDTVEDSLSTFMHVGIDGRQAGGHNPYPHGQFGSIEKTSFVEDDFYNLYPIRTKMSDIIDDNLLKVNTLLNPNGSTTTGGYQKGHSFTGALHLNGYFPAAGLASMANQASTSANAFTIHVVAQAIQDVGREVPGITKSGVGYHDLDDRVVAEQWAQIVVGKTPQISGGAIVTGAGGKPENDYSILYYRVLDNPK